MEPDRNPPSLIKYILLFPFHLSVLACAVIAFSKLAKSPITSFTGIITGILVVTALFSAWHFAFDNRRGADFKEATILTIGSLMISLPASIAGLLILSSLKSVSSSIFLPKQDAILQKISAIPAVTSVLITVTAVATLMLLLFAVFRSGSSFWARRLGRRKFGD